MLMWEGEGVRKEDREKEEERERKKRGIEEGFLQKGTYTKCEPQKF